MKFLMLTHVPFWQRAMGSHMRLYAVIRHYLEAGNDVNVGLLDHVVAPQADQCKLLRNYEKLKFLCMGEKQKAQPFLMRVRLWVASILKRQIYRSGSGWENELCRLYGHQALYNPAPFANALYVRKWMQQYKPDVVMLVYIHTAYLIPVVRNVQQAPRLVLLDTIDVQSLRCEAFREKGLGHWLEIDSETEIQLADQADIVVAIQNKEADFFRRKLKQAETQILYHGHQIIPLDGSKNTMTLLFVGGEMLPNVMGLQEFLDQCWPVILEKTQGLARLRIVGKVCNALRGGEELPKGVTLVGFVDDLIGEYELANVIIAPIGFGGGQKIKVVEALCHGRAVVTTSSGAEGLPVASDLPFLIAESIESMSGLIIELLVDAKKREHHELLAREYAARHFGDNSCFRDLDMRIATILKDQPDLCKRSGNRYEHRMRAVLFGTGSGGGNGYKYLKRDYDIIGFCDNSKDRQGNQFCGLPVYAPSELHTLSFDRIMICSMHKDAIGKQLQEEFDVHPASIENLTAGIRNGRDWSGPILFSSVFIVILIIALQILFD